MNSNDSELDVYMAEWEIDFLNKHIIVDSDKGSLNISIIKLFERTYDVKLPSLYTKLIAKHNELYLKNDSFDYCINGQIYTGSVRFDEFGKVISFYDYILKEQERQDIDTFPSKMVPFGDDGGEGIFFFDYRDTTSEPKITMIAEGEETIIADSFESLISKLYISEDSIASSIECIEDIIKRNIPSSYTEYVKIHCSKTPNKKYELNDRIFHFLIPSDIFKNFLYPENKVHCSKMLPFAIDQLDNYIGFSLETFKICYVNGKSGTANLITNNFEEFINMLHESSD